MVDSTPQVSTRHFWTDKVVRYPDWPPQLHHTVLTAWQHQRCACCQLHCHEAPQESSTAFFNGCLLHLTCRWFIKTKKKKKFGALQYTKYDLKKNSWKSNWMSRNVLLYLRHLRTSKNKTKASFFPLNAQVGHLVVWLLCYFFFFAQAASAWSTLGRQLHSSSNIYVCKTPTMKSKCCNIGK